MHVVRQDELEDVILEGRTQVSDDPSAWIIPQAMRVLEARKDIRADIFAWWDKLVTLDDALDQMGGAGVGDAMQEMRTDWQRIYGTVTGARFDGHGSNIQGRKLIYEALALGLVIAQVANLYGITQQEVILVMYQGENLTTEDVESYLKLEGLLREASCTWKAAGLACGFTAPRVQNFGTRLGIPPTNGNGKSLRHPAHIRAKAMELLDEGLTNAEASAWIETNMMHDVNRFTIGQWAKRSGRAKPNVRTTGGVA